MEKIDEMAELRKELQSYFDRVYPYSRIDTEHTIGGQVHIRFELGSGMENGTTERVDRSTKRALLIFNDLFPIPDNDLFVLIYEYEEPHTSDDPNVHLHNQFPAESFAQFYNQIETVNSRYFTRDKAGNEIVEKHSVRIIIGKLPVKDVQVENILRSIANNEMGFTPRIPQRIFFFDPLTDKGFQMYDDRGCYAWSNTAVKIRDLYIRRNDWIVDYHRPEIEAYFKE